jgi:signal transduction histidine kinase
MARDPGVTPADLRLYHDRIELAGRTLLELVEGTLEIGKLESGRDDIQLQRVDLPAFWDRLGREYAVLPRNQRVVLEWRPNVPAVVVLADPRKLAMIVRNLVGNALKFTDEGFVRAEALLDGDHVVLRVSDSGIGIDPQDQERIFEMFRQGDGSDSRRHAGTGLGLYIVRRFVQQLGGTVRLASAPGHGAVFEVRLPSAAVRQPDEMARAAG